MMRLLKKNGKKNHPSPMKMRFALTAISLFFSAYSFSASLKIGTIDVSRVVDNSEWGRSIKASLEKEALSKKDAIEKEQMALQTLGQKLQDPNAQGLTNKKAREKEVIAFQTRAKNLRELVEKSEMEINQKKVELYKPVVEELRTLAEAMAKKKNLDLVLEVQNGVGAGSSPLIYAAQKEDLSDEITKALNEKKKN
jgi:outer membrane protein